ncbi:MAG: Arm DNA-binding domain-containing protein [Cyanobacteria bacterium]|nr:Arm DNA-binding domain-containing protein [Cyanobacteriota bacterium]
MKKKLTVVEVKSLRRPETGEKFVWDTELSCFGIKLTPTRASYVVQCRVNGKTVKHVVGRVGETSLHEARIRAMKALSELRSGVDLNSCKAEDKTRAITLGKHFRRSNRQRHCDLEQSRHMMKTSIGVLLIGLTSL